MRSRESAHHDEYAYHGPERRTHGSAAAIEPVVLTRKYAEAIDGVNLAGCEVGDRLPVNPVEARLLIAEGWAAPTPRDQRRRSPAQDHGPPDREQIA